MIESVENRAFAVRIDSLFLDLDLICRRCEPAAKLARGIAEFRTYIWDNRGSIPNFGER